MSNESSKPMAERPLELDDDPGFQRRMWIWQRWAWGGIAGVLAFAAAGGFGDGPLSRAEARDREGRLRVVYERFGRLDAPNDVEVEARPGPDGRLQLRLGAKFLEDFDVELPEPHRPEATVDAAAGTVAASLPEGVRVFFLNLYDDGGRVVSTEHVEIP